MQLLKRLEKNGLRTSTMVVSSLMSQTDHSKLHTYAHISVVCGHCIATWHMHACVSIAIHVVMHVICLLHCRVAVCLPFRQIVRLLSDLCNCARLIDWPLRLHEREGVAQQIVQNTDQHLVLAER